MLRKIISFILFVVSGSIIGIYLLTLNQLVGSLGVSLDIGEIIDLLESSDGESTLFLLSIVANTFIEYFGIPLTMFGVSIIGLTLPVKR
jgi:hypothetical protein